MAEFSAAQGPDRRLPEKTLGRIFPRTIDSAASDPPPRSNSLFERSSDGGGTTQALLPFPFLIGRFPVGRLPVGSAYFRGNDFLTFAFGYRLAGTYNIERHKIEDLL